MTPATFHTNQKLISMNEEMIFFIFAVILISTVGYLAQRVGLCMVKGVKEASVGKPSFLFAILCSGSFAWVAMFLLQFTAIDVHFGAYEASIYSFLGGLLFGLGAAFNDGCGVSTISRLMRGQSVMVATITGWLIGWVLFTDYAQHIKPQALSFDLGFQQIILFVFSLIILAVVYKMKEKNKIVWRDMLMIGLIASLIFLYEPKWTPSGLLKDVGISLWAENATIWPSVNRFILMFCLMLGMLISTIHTKTFKLTFYSIPRYLSHLSAGILMGIGAVVAGGGNDSQLLIALPSLSPAGFSTIFSIIVGIFIGNQVTRWILNRRQVKEPIA